MARSFSFEGTLPADGSVSAEGVRAAVQQETGQVVDIKPGMDRSFLISGFVPEEAVPAIRASLRKLGVVEQAAGADK